jgi:hypothetical protein
MTEDYPLTPIMELKLYKKLLDEAINEQRKRWEDEKKQYKNIVKQQSESDYPRLDTMTNQSGKAHREVDKLNALCSARELFHVVKQRHNQEIKDIKENGELLKEIEDTEKLLRLKKEKAKEKMLIIPRKKKENKI